MSKKSIKKHFRYLFEQGNVKKQVVFDNKQKIQSPEDAISVILAFNIAHAFFNNSEETMLQSAYKGQKVKGNSNVSMSSGKEVDITKILSPAGLNLKNPTSYANNKKDDVTSTTNIKNFIALTTQAIEFLKSKNVKNVMLENNQKIKINRQTFNIEVKKLLDDKLKSIINKDSSKINLTLLIKHFRDNVDSVIKTSSKDKNSKEGKVR